jgi:hypothetical protein
MQSTSATRSWAIFERLSSEDFRNEVLQAMVIEAHISRSKYRHVVASIRFLAAMTTFGFTYFAILSIAS